MTHKLSAVIITFNEEKNIQRCIEAALPVADEIVVVDSFSTDKTPQLASNYEKVKFIQTQWEGYSKTKNFANQQASHHYILSLDADEFISPQLRDSILTEKEYGFTGTYSFNRLTNYCGQFVKHCGWYPDEKIRIFPKNKALWEGDFVHETLRVTDSSLKNKHLKGDLLHYSYYTISEHLQRIEKYAQLHAQKMKSEGKKFSAIKEWGSPAAKFIKTYFLQLGFLDGKAGWNISRLSAKAVYLKYNKLRKLYRNDV
jgi:glycosyltransferase involved in cell wall biosynthesis